MKKCGKVKDCIHLPTFTITNIEDAQTLILIIKPIPENKFRNR